jgi:chemotaxis protein CheX
MSLLAEPDVSLNMANQHLVRAVRDSVESALMMCGTQARCVGVSIVPGREVGKITGLIGVHGRVSGFVTVNMAERVAIRAVEGLLQDRFGQLCPQVVDGAGEITNLIGGGIKSALAGTPWSFSHITIPSVIVGQGYQIAYARGLEFACVTFEHADEQSLVLDERLLQVSVSLLKL